MKKILFLAFAAPFLLGSCVYVSGKKVNGSDNLTTENRSVGNFNGVKSYGSFDVYVSTAGERSVRIEAEDNLLPYIETELDGDILKVRTKPGYWLRPHKQVKVYVAAPAFTTIHSYGSGDIIGENTVTDPDKIDMEIAGSADIKMQIDAPEVSARIAGSGNIILSGQTKTFKADIKGSGDVKAMDLKSEDTDIDITGSGGADVYASVNLDVHIAGSGDVRYRGNGQVSSHIAGSGSVKKVD